MANKEEQVKLNQIIFQLREQLKFMLSFQQMIDS